MFNFIRKLFKKPNKYPVHMVSDGVKYHILNVESEQEAAQLHNGIWNNQTRIMPERCKHKSLERQCREMVQYEEGFY